jgi:hypothetical protein
MRRLRFIISLLLLTALPPHAQAKKRTSEGNWQVVQNLSIGTPISVKARAPHLMCYFERATDDALFCQPLRRRGPATSRRPYPSPFPLPLPPQPAEYVFKRQEIREIRLEHSEGTNQMLGALTVGGVMAAIGAARNGNSSGLTRGGGALWGGAIGALIGGVFGRDFPLFHRKVIYRR